MYLAGILMFTLVVYTQASMTCVGRCTNPFDSSMPCHCNTKCNQYKNCCQDYDAICGSKLSSTSSCSGRCGHGIDKTKPCQCNTACKNFNDCCQDYDQICKGTNTGGGSLTSLMEDLWKSDVNRFPETDYVLNYQTQVTDSNRQDKASQKLFTSVKTGRFSSLTTYSTFIRLLDNYDINVGVNDNISPAEWTEINAFLDAILSTSVMKKAYAFLHTNGYIPDNAVQWRGYLKELWFNLYPRSGSHQHITDSSGFEHILAGELKSTTVNGFHNWIQFYLEESAGRLNYAGYVTKAPPRTVGSQFSWHGKWKGLGSFFVGVSPEFDVAVYSVCAIVHKGSKCSFTLDGKPVQIQSYDVSHKSGNQLGTAYIIG